jgi:hypothetical protein
MADLNANHGLMAFLSPLPARRKNKSLENHSLGTQFQKNNNLNKVFPIFTDNLGKSA